MGKQRIQPHGATKFGHSRRVVAPQVVAAPQAIAELGRGRICGYGAAKGLLSGRIVVLLEIGFAEVEPRLSVARHSGNRALIGDNRGWVAPLAGVQQPQHQMRLGAVGLLPHRLFEQGQGIVVAIDARKQNRQLSPRLGVARR